MLWGPHRGQAWLTMYVGPESPVRVYCSVSTTSIPEALLRPVASGWGFPTLCAFGMLMALGVLQGEQVVWTARPCLMLSMLQPKGYSTCAAALCLPECAPGALLMQCSWPYEAQGTAYE